MFTKILIANRGEIACRVIATARKMGVASVAVYSDADAGALHVSMADEAIHIGPAASRESYLCGDKIIAAALKTGAQAIHPGYGFLSENAEFCRQCEANGLVFIGPPAAAIDAMGSKSAAKKIMQQAGVPLVPGYHGDDQDRDTLKRAADDMGYPVLLKAAAGGGGKGMRQVWSEAEFDQALEAAKREAINAFGDDHMLVEKYLTGPRHVEIQVFCDITGEGVYLFERDCSLQRRHQKVIEEAPAPGVSAELRSAMGDAALKAARAIDYRGAGTVEFLLDSDGAFYFMEMNTRLQVEHPVTELISGQDLVEWQLRVAAGEGLPLRQEQLRINGHAFEARVYAEDPDNDFLPATGVLEFLQAPEPSAHVRVDTGVRQGDEISVYYDPMIAKLVVWDENRDRALARLCSALRQYRIAGTTTNLKFLHNLASSQAFKAAQLDTGFIEKHSAEIFREDEQSLPQTLALAGLYLVLQQARAGAADAAASGDTNSPWHATDTWRCNESGQQTFELERQQQQYSVHINALPAAGQGAYRIAWGEHPFEARGKLSGNSLQAELDGHRLCATVAHCGDELSVYTEAGSCEFTLAKADTGEDSARDSGGGLNAPMNGTIVAHSVAPGSRVAGGDALLVMEAMKMEHTLRAPGAGVVNGFFFQPGELVDGGALLLDFAPSEAE